MPYPFVSGERVRASDLNDAIRTSRDMAVEAQHKASEAQTAASGIIVDATAAAVAAAAGPASEAGISAALAAGSAVNASNSAAVAAAARDTALGTVDAPRLASSFVLTVDWLNDGTKHYRRTRGGLVTGRTTEDGVRYGWSGSAYVRRDRSVDDEASVGVASRWTYTVDWANSAMAHMRRNAAGQVLAYRTSAGVSLRWNASEYLNLDPVSGTGEVTPVASTGPIATVDWLNLGAAHYRRTASGLLTGLRLRDASERRWTGLTYQTIGGVDPLPPFSAPMGHLVREEAARIVAAYIKQAGLTAPAAVVPAEAAAAPVPSTDTATYAYGRSGTAIPNADFTYGGRKFRANVQRNDHDPGFIEENGNPIGGEGPGAYVRVTYSDDYGATWTPCRFFLPVDNTKSVLDPYVKRLVDGRMLFLIPTSGSARRSTWGCILENPDEGSGTNFVWGPLRFQDYGFASVPEYVNGELLWLANEPIAPADNDAQEDWRGAKLCRIRIYGNEPRSERISRLPWVKNGDGTASTINSFQETSIIPFGAAGIRVPFRTADGYYQTVSRDAGLTWSTPVPWTAFPAIASRHHFARSPRGVLWCAGHDVPLGDARRRGMLRASLDDGETWPADLSFCFDPRAPLSYHRISFERAKVGGAYTGRIHVEYDRGRGRVQDPSAPTGWLSEIVQAVIVEDDLIRGVRAATLTTTER